MTKALDAAIEAAQELYDAGDDDDVAIPAALRAALPAEPTAAAIEAIQNGDVLDEDDAYARSAYRALRAHLLGEGDITEDRRPWDEYAGEDA